MEKDLGSSLLQAEAEQKPEAKNEKLDDQIGKMGDVLEDTVGRDVAELIALGMTPEEIEAYLGAEWKGEEGLEELTEEEQIARKAMIERIEKQLQQNIEPWLDPEEEIEKEWKQQSKCRICDPNVKTMRPVNSLKSIQYNPRPGHRVVNITGSKYRDRHGHKMLSYLPREMLPIPARKTKPKTPAKKTSSIEGKTKKDMDETTKSLDQPILYSELFTPAEELAPVPTEKSVPVGKLEDELPPVKHSLKSPTKAKTREKKLQKLHVAQPVDPSMSTTKSLDSFLQKGNNQFDSARKGSADSERRIRTPGSRSVSMGVAGDPKSRVATADGCIKSKRKYKKNGTDRMREVKTPLSKLSVSSGAGTVEACNKPQMREMRNLTDVMMTTTGMAYMAFHPEMGPRMQEEVLDTLEKSKQMGRQTRARQKEDHTWTLLTTPGFYEAIGPDKAFQSNSMATHMFDDRYSQQIVQSDRSQCLQKNPIAQWANEAVKCNFKIFVPMGSMKV
jgi:hypothetical protein